MRTVPIFPYLETKAMRALGDGLSGIGRFKKVMFPQSIILWEITYSKGGTSGNVPLFDTF